MLSEDADWVYFRMLLCVEAFTLLVEVRVFVTRYLEFLRLLGLSDEDLEAMQSQVSV